MISTQSKYLSQCGSCAAQITPGDWIIKLDNGRWGCVTCGEDNKRHLNQRHADTLSWNGVASERPSDWRR